MVCLCKKFAAKVKIVIGNWRIGKLRNWESAGL
jgi:hypothetical protein